MRFVVRDHGIRDVKDAMSRDIIAALDEAGIGIASATFEVVGLPPLRLERAPRERRPRLTAPAESRRGRATPGVPGFRRKARPEKPCGPST